MMVNSGMKPCTRAQCRVSISLCTALTATLFCGHCLFQTYHPCKDNKKGASKASIVHTVLSWVHRGPETLTLSRYLEKFGPV